MGLLYQAIKIPNAITLSFFLNIFSQARFIFIGALTRLGLYKPPPEEDANSTDNSERFILIFDGSCPSFVPIPVSVVTAAIKRKVPIVQFRDLIVRLQEEENEQEIVAAVEEEVIRCSICLDCVESEHEVRELCNCSHVFHRLCLDTWVDEGQVTCPLCRSNLLPPRTNLFNNRCNGGEVAL